MYYIRIKCIQDVFLYREGNTAVEKKIINNHIIIIIINDKSISPFYGTHAYIIIIYNII